MTSIRKRTVAFVAVAFFLFVMTILLLIGSAKDIHDLNELINTYRSYVIIYDQDYYTEINYLTSLRGVCIVKLIFSIIIMITSIVTSIVSFTSKKDGSPLALSVTSFTLFVINYIIAFFMTWGIAKSLNPSIEMSATSIVAILFVFMSLFLFLISYICLGAKAKVGAAFTNIFGSAVLLIAIIVTLAESASTATNALSVVYQVFIIISILANIVASGIFVGFLSEGASNDMEQPVVEQPVAVETVQVVEKPAPAPEEVKPSPAPVPVESMIKTNNEDPIESLKKLKNLFDEGIITEEEYKEVRKKYVEKL